MSLKTLEFATYFNQERVHTLPKPLKNVKKVTLTKIYVENAGLRPWATLEFDFGNNDQIERETDFSANDKIGRTNGVLIPLGYNSNLDYSTTGTLMDKPVVAVNTYIRQEFGTKLGHIVGDGTIDYSVAGLKIWAVLKIDYID